VPLQRLAQAGGHISAILRVPFRYFAAQNADHESRLQQSENGRDEGGE
jgi:hypothetical protein